MWLGKDNELRTINLGLIHSSAAASIVELIHRRLRPDGEIEDAISPNFLRRNWPAFPEWSTKAVRDAFFASPRLPRLADPNAIKDTIVTGVREGSLAYLGKAADGRYDPFYFRAQLNPYHVELSDEMFIIRGDTAEAYLAVRQQAAAAQELGVRGQGAESGELVVREGLATETPDMRGSGTSRFQTAVPVEPRARAIETDRRKRRRCAARLGRRGTRAEVDELLHQGALALCRRRWPEADGKGRSRARPAGCRSRRWRRRRWP